MNKFIKLDFETKFFGKPNIAIIALHGWGGNKSSMVPLIDLVKVDNCQWFFPEAIYTKKGDQGGKSWTYQKEDGSYERDEPIDALQHFIKEEVFSLYRSSDVYIIGFSQGALMCYEAVLTMEFEFGGVFPISGFIAKQNKDKGYPNKMLKSTPIFIGHGKDDQIVSSDASKEAFHIINKANFNVELILYSGGHKIGIEYLRKMKSAIKHKK